MTSLNFYQKKKNSLKSVEIFLNGDAAAFDTEDSAEMAFWMKNVMPYQGGNDGNIRCWRMKDLSQNWENDMSPARFVKMTTFIIKPDERTDFFSFWKNNTKFQKELGNSGITTLFMLVTEGESYKILEVQPYNSHAEGMGKMSDPDVNYIDKYNEMFGWRTWSNDQAAYYASIEKWGIKVETAELKTEISSKLKQFILKNKKVD